MAAGPRIVVVGGGIAGAFTAMFAARAGADVVVLERDHDLRNASTQNPGGLNPVHGRPASAEYAAFAMESFAIHQELWPALSAVAPADFGGRAARRLHVALNDDDAERLLGEISLYKATPGFDAQWVDTAAAGQVEPRLSAEVVGALDVVGNLRVDSRAYLAAVTAAAVDAGARWRVAEMTGVQTRGGTVTAVVTGDGDIGCDHVVIATGASTAGPADWLGIELPVEAVQGEMLLVKAPAGANVEVTHGRCGVYPNADGTVWLGGTEQRGIQTAAPTDAGRDVIVAGVARFMTGVVDAELVTRTAALRPVTVDGLPVIGRLPGSSNVVTALGAGRKGMLLSAGLGRAAADLCCTGETALSIAGFGADRGMANA